MSYQVIARKWRPGTFEEVIGQPHATRTLQNAIRLDRIAHAYLFSGARGVGKTSVARILAKVLNCEKGPSPTPCNECSNCREISHTNSVDVIEIDGASNRGIDNIRELREAVRYRPAKGRYKVYIIDEVHMLTTEAFNALLKTLEEPPPHVIFIFATTEPHKIPATILSRCQRFDFRRLSLLQIVEHLKRITSQEGADFSEGILYAIAREADGSMRDAQSLLEQLLAFSGDELPEAEILDILGVIDRQSVLRTGEAILSANPQACLDLVSDIYRRGIDSRRFCQHLCDHFRNLLFAAISDDREMGLDLPEDEKKLLKDQAAATTPESLHVYFQMLLQGEEQIRRSSMPKIALEMLLLRMVQLPKLESLDAVLDKIAMVEQSLKEGHSASACIVSESRRDFEKTAPSPAAPAGPSSFAPPSGSVENQPGALSREKPEATNVVPLSGFTSDSGHVRDSSDITDNRESLTTPNAEFPIEANVPLAALREQEPDAPMSALKAVDGWPAFVAFLENHNPVLWAKVSHCAVKASGDILELEVPDMYEKSADGPEFIRKLEDASQAFFGSRLQWMTTIKKTSQTSRGAEARGLKTGKLSGTKQIVNHPAVQQAIEILGAELIEVKPSKGFEPQR
ncbi:MAG: DNA polymerase III subunit gamma/tau [Syntrophobacteraceae bacterium]